jgi:cation:H+ antiporter
VTASTRSRPTGTTPWHRQIAVAAGFALGGVALHALGPLVPVPLAALGMGLGVLGAAFMLAWAADAGEAVFSGGLVLAAVALVGVLPEFIIEIHFAYIQQAELVTANLTGATRLLLTGAVALPLLLALRGRGDGPGDRAGDGGGVEPIRLATPRRLELGVLLVSSVFAVQIVVRGSLTVVDGIVLIALYVLYARRVQGTSYEEPAQVGVAAGLLSLPPRYQRPAVLALLLAAGAVVVLIANPFTHALLATGTSLGMDPYLLIQSVVPVATEAPELVVVAVLVANRRPGQGLALLLAASVSQWTLGMGLLPLAYLAGGGGMALPLGAREQVELGFTTALTLFVVAALATLRPARVDAVLIVVVFVLQLVYPTAFTRFAAGFVLLVFALDLLASRRKELRPILRSVGRGRRTSA